MKQKTFTEPLNSPTSLFYVNDRELRKNNT